jgi:hypothetical protein
VTISNEGKVTADVEVVPAPGARAALLSALSGAPVGALCDREALADHLLARLGLPGDDGGPREYATLVRSKVDGREPLVLPASGNDEAKSRAQAEATARTIDADPGETSAEVVWRPRGGWRAL